MKDWFIEDAGGGCRAFSEVLVLVCEEPRLIYKSFLPLTWSKGITMEEMACRKVIKMMQKAGVTRQDQLHVCTSNIFYGLHKWLDQNGYCWGPLKMDGLAHHVAEHTFNNQIFDAGFPAEIQLEERNYRDFYRRVDQWLKKDPHRACYLKDMEVRRKPEQLRYLLKGNSARTRICYHCKKKIMPYKPIVHYRSKEKGKKINRYFHPSCSPFEPSKNKLQQIWVHWAGEPVDGVILPARKPLPCMVCTREIPVGTAALHAKNGNVFLYGHPECFTPIDPSKV